MAIMAHASERKLCATARAGHNKLKGLHEKQKVEVSDTTMLNNASAVRSKKNIALNKGGRTGMQPEYKLLSEYKQF